MTDLAIFKQKVVFITGAGSGIGPATALAFAELGAQTVLVGRKKAPLEETAQNITQAGHLAPLIIENCDVSQEDNLKSALSQTFEKFGRLDIAFNNAGMADSALGPLADINSDAYQRMMQVNVDGVFFAMKHEIPLMRQTIEKFKTEAGAGGQCRILNTASIAGLIGFANAAALDYANDKIAINAIAPGPVETPLVHEFTQTEANDTAFKQQIPMKRYGTSEEIAELVIGLCSPQMKFITGTVITIDGGITAGH
ncbi:SDR family oxidoreductase [Acetobacteraceae bacterium]|nr:SDR family oxidoreductase [Acetobacteraceae bacterium]